MAPLFIGIDAGGSKTEVWAASPTFDRPVQLRGAGANLQRKGLARAAAILVDLILDVSTSFAEADRLFICAGVAGADDAADRERLSAEIRHVLTRRGLPSRTRLGPVQVVQDSAVALAAAIGDGSGAVIIIGTGSVVLARTRQATLIRAGGWGYLLGDEGGGHAIGLAGLKLVTAAFDGQATGVLPAMVKQHFGIDTGAELVRKVYQEKWPVQEIAPLVIQAAEEGDGPANQILEAQARLLAAQFHQVVRQAGTEIEPRVVLLGGLTQATWYRQKMEHAIMEDHPAWQVQPPAYARPVEGALSMARNMLN